MADIFDSAKRSEVMSKIKGKNTKVEVLVFKYLRKENIYFQKHYRTRIGVRLDVASPRKKKAVFIDGDFWHGRTIERMIERRGEEDFWTKKLGRNIERDKQQEALLKSHGWTFIRVWESDLMRKKTRDSELQKIRNFLLS